MMKERVLKILKSVVPRMDFEKEKKLVSEHLLDSFAILSIVAQIEEEFDIELAPEDLVPDNLDSIEALVKMIQRSLEGNEGANL